MNEYGTFAMRTWRMLAPEAFRQIADPETFFRQLGEQAADQVVDLTRQLQGPDLPGETYFGKVGRINAARMQAEEVVRAELLTPPRELWEEEDENEGLEHLDSLMAMYAEEQRDMDLAQMEPFDSE